MPPRKAKGPQATPGQLDLGGRVVPPERPHPLLRKAGFPIHQHGDLLFYGDPFRPHLRLTVGQARGLLKARQLVVSAGGFRLRYPASGYSEVRLGQRRKTQQGAWHEMVVATGQRHAPPGYWIVDGNGTRVWPVGDEEPPATTNATG